MAINEVKLENKIIGEISFCSCFRHIIITIFGKKNKSYTCCGDKPEEYIPKVIDVDETFLERLYRIEESFLKRNICYLQAHISKFY